MSIIKKIKDYYKSNKSLLFTTPTHSQGSFIIPDAQDILGSQYFKSDFSEIDGFDNLRAPQDTIKAVLEQISQIYHSKYSFMLTNGSTSGILAAMLSVLKNNDKVLIARNCHISVYNGLVLTGARPLWFLPDADEQWGIYKGITAKDIEKYFESENDIKAVIITSPTYEGIFSDIKNISEICKKNSAILIVDEAHGALLNFADLGSKPAILSGADISIQSLHKTAGAINPAALMHIADSSPVKPESVQNALNLINTTSPSYPLMADIEATVKYLNSSAGKEHITNLLQQIEIFKTCLSQNISCYSENNDKTKLLLRFNGCNALDIAEILNTKYNIEEEYSTQKALLFITGIGTTPEKLKKLSEALFNISDENFESHADCTNPLNLTLPVMKYTPGAAYQLDSKIIDKDSAQGCICAECIMKYPPGIPLLLPGELIQNSHLCCIEKSTVRVI